MMHDELFCWRIEFEAVALKATDALLAQLSAEQEASTALEQAVDGLAKFVDAIGRAEGARKASAALPGLGGTA